MKPRTSAEQHLEDKREDAEYASAYASAARRIRMFDEVVRGMDARRRDLGLTKAELARRADLPAAVVRRLFSHQHKNPTLTTLVAIADALGLDLRPVAMDGQAPARAQVRTTLPSGASETRRRTA